MPTPSLSYTYNRDLHAIELLQNGIEGEKMITRKNREGNDGNAKEGFHGEHDHWSVLFEKLVLIFTDKIESIGGE